MSKSEVIRIPARARPVWARLVAKIRGDLGREVPESECFSLIISEWDMQTGGAGVLPDDAPFYEVMPEERKATGPEDLVNAHETGAGSGEQVRRASTRTLPGNSSNRETEAD